MPQVIDNREKPNTASVPSPPNSGKRPRDKDGSFNEVRTRNGNDPKNKAVVRGIGSKYVQVVGHRESHKSIAAAETHPIDSDSNQKSRDDGFANEHSQKRLNSKHPSNLYGREGRQWKDRLSELADYRKIHGHCNVPDTHSENLKLGIWVRTQRQQYRLHHVEGKTPPMSNFRIQELEGIGFKWKVGGDGRQWEDRLSELADYRKIHGHCNVPKSWCSENPKLVNWVSKQRQQYRLHVEGKISQLTLCRIQELERLGFEWNVCITAWEERLSELADYRKIHGHCNVPDTHSENLKLANWVSKQRQQYRMHVEGKRSQMTLSRIQELESLGFKWQHPVITAWDDRLSELADYRKIYGHCNVPYSCSENPKLANWVNNQRTQYRLHVEGKRSQITFSRIQELKSLGFEWKPRISRRKEPPKNSNLDNDATSTYGKDVESLDQMQQYCLNNALAREKSAAESILTLSQVEPQQTKRLKTGDVLFDETNLDDSHSALAWH
jgi:arsenate reductase-like glutaredoxin family protein